MKTARLPCRPDDLFVMDDGTFQLVRDCFEHDDGSLPGVLLDGLNSDQLAAIYTYIRSRSRLSGSSPSFWDKREGRDVALDAIANPAELVGRGQVDGFHFCFTELEVAGVKLPELGLSV